MKIENDKLVEEMFFLEQHIKHLQLCYNKGQVFHEKGSTNLIGPFLYQSKK